MFWWCSILRYWDFLCSQDRWSHIHIWLVKETELKQCHNCKVHIFWEGHKILRDLPLTFDCLYCSQKGEDFTQFCGLLRIYELYHSKIQSHYREVARWEIFWNRNWDLGWIWAGLATFEADFFMFSWARKSFKNIVDGENIFGIEWS